MKSLVAVGCILVVGLCAYGYGPFCDDPWHLSPYADMDGDCYVGPNDVIILSEHWLECTDPCIPGCQNLLPDVRYIPSGECVVDGFADDWVDPCWIGLNKVYVGYPYFPRGDILYARYSLKWDDITNKIYAMIVVDDQNHIFESFPTGSRTSDRVRFYTQGDPNGGRFWGREQYETFHRAQEYLVGSMGFNGWAWEVLGDGSMIPGVVSFEAAVRVEGSFINYEIGTPVFSWMGAKISNGISVSRDLEPGVQIGVDVLAFTRWGTYPHDDSEWGILANNLNGPKHVFADTFQLWELLAPDDSIVFPQCGNWGYSSADVDFDCYVDLRDFAAMHGAWLYCTHPDPPCSYNP